MNERSFRTTGRGGAYLARVISLSALSIGCLAGMSALAAAEPSDQPQRLGDLTPEQQEWLHWDAGFATPTGDLLCAEHPDFGHCSDGGLPPLVAYNFPANIDLFTVTVQYTPPITEEK